jgi:hypothetical protein
MTDPVKASPTGAPVENPTPPVTQKSVAAPAVDMPKFMGSNPSDWEVSPVEDDPESITATNNATGETFEGTIAEFNARRK